MRSAELKFYLQRMGQMAPTPNNLRRWGYTGDSSCSFCKTRGCSLYHILSTCDTALQGGRYTWRHDEVLRVLHHFIGKKIRSMSLGLVQRPARRHCMVFVKEGEKPPTKTTKRDPPLLTQASDWRITVDLPAMKYTFPGHIGVTEQRPDLVL